MIIKSINSENSNLNRADNQNSKRGRRAEKSKKSSGVIYAGNLNIENDVIGIKKQQAQKKAMKAIIDKFNAEKKTDDGVQKLKDNKTKIIAEMDMVKGHIKNLETTKQNLKDAYGITDDSSEQKDLEVLEKSFFGNEELTDNEQKQLAAMGPLTEYQKEAFACQSQQEFWKQRVEDLGNGITNISKSIESIGLAKLKTHPMVDAQKEAAKILEESSKTVISIMIHDAKETEDKKLDDNEKKAEKEQKAKEEEDAEKAKAEQKKEAAQPSAQTTQSVQPTSNPDSGNVKPDTAASSDQLELLNDIKDFAKKQVMLDEDIKGIVVDNHA